MNLEEAIKYCDEVAKEKYLQGMLCHANPNDEHLDNYIECAKQHEQLKIWLIDYKKLAEENEILRSEIKALNEEVAQKCELNEKNCKALDKACAELSSMDYKLKMHENPYAYTCNYTDEEEWKEWAMDNERW